MRKHSKLIKAIKTDPEIVGYYLTKKSEIEKWFKIINKEVFSSELPPFQKINVRRLRGVWSYVSVWEEPQGDDIVRCSSLAFDEFTCSRKHFLEILSHEMVHHYTWIVQNEFDVAHGKSFYSWKEPLAKFGINLKARQDPED